MVSFVARLFSGPRIASVALGYGRIALLLSLCLAAAGARWSNRFPPLVSSNPSQGAVNVPRTALIRLDFEFLPSHPLTWLRCGNKKVTTKSFSLNGRSLVLLPEVDLPAAAQCVVRWLGQPPGPQAHRELVFSTAGRGAPAHVIYDRENPRGVTPFPDDIWLVQDARTATGSRVHLEVPAVPGELDRALFTSLVGLANRLDGFSPIAHLVVEFSDRPDPSSLPTTVQDSLDPLASVGLFDLDPAGLNHGARIPFEAKLRSDTITVFGEVRTSHVMLIFPAVPLTPGKSYGLVVTRRAVADPSRPFDPSPSFAKLLGPASIGETPQATQARHLTQEVLDALSRHAAVPIATAQVALALRISIRSDDGIPQDLLTIRSTLMNAPPPTFRIGSVVPSSLPGVGAIVYGTWKAFEWRVGRNFARDDRGLPIQTGTKDVPFVLALPHTARDAPAPMVIYQHGNPGSAEREVPFAAGGQPSKQGTTLAQEGFAVVGFTDPINREVTPGVTDFGLAGSLQAQALIFGLLTSQKIPDFHAMANAEQLDFLRLIGTFGALDVLPLDAAGRPLGDGVPDLDLTASLSYVGISNGAVHGPALLPYAPEIRAAALVAGAGRFVEILLHQAADSFLTFLPLFFSTLSPAEIWYGFALFQMGFDGQDSHNHAPFLYRYPLNVGDVSRASILLTEGIGDSFVPNNATRSLAWALGPIPHLLPIRESVPMLDVARSPLIGNVNGSTSAAFYQFVPAGIPALPATPGCMFQFEGHFCPQVAPEALTQRIRLLRSALGVGPPVIIDPLED